MFFTNIDRPRDQGWPGLDTKSEGTPAGSLSEPERFLESCCYPDIKRRQLTPSTLIFNWPRMVRIFVKMRMVRIFVKILDLEFSWEHFSQRDLSGMVLVATMTLMEFPSGTGITAQDVRKRGALRIPAEWFEGVTGITASSVEGRQFVSTQQTRAAPR